MFERFFQRLGSGKTLEQFKFSIYLIVPIGAVLLYSQPAVHETALKTSRYVVYTNAKMPVFGKKKQEQQEKGVVGEEKEEVEAGAQHAEGQQQRQRELR